MDIRNIKFVDLSTTAARDALHSCVRADAQLPGLPAQRMALQGEEDTGEHVRAGHCCWQPWEQLPHSVLKFLRARGAAAGLAGAAGGDQRRGGVRAARAAAGPGAPGAEGKRGVGLFGTHAAGPGMPGAAKQGSDCLVHVLQDLARQEQRASKLVFLHAG